VVAVKLQTVGAVVDVIEEIARSLQEILFQQGDRLFAYYIMSGRLTVI